MWAQELFKTFIEKDSAKEQELIDKHSPLTKIHSLQSMKNVYMKYKKHGITPFIVAILHDNIALCEQLIHEGIDFGGEASAGVFDEKQFLKFNEDVSEFIVKGSKSNNVFAGFNKTTPMFWAITCNKIMLIRSLILSGHKMNFLVETCAGMPALSCAVMSRNIQAVKYFLLHQACDIHENSLPEMKPLDVAIRSGNTDMVKLLLRHGENLDCPNHQMSPLTQAVFLNNLLMVDFILSMGANVNFGLETGTFFPPLNMAILRANFEIAHFLILKGADVQVKDSTGNTALHLLSRHFKAQPGSSINRPAVKLAQSLIERGARVDVVNEEYQSPLLQAVYLGEPEIVDLYLTTAVPVDVNTVLVRLKTSLLHIAVSPPVRLHENSQFWLGPGCVEGHRDKDYWQKRLSIVQSLIKKGADVNKQCAEGITVLHLAVKCNYVKLVKLLIESKVDVNKRGVNGMTALHYAVSSERSDLVKLLLASGAKVNVEDKFGLTPLDHGIIENEGICYNTVKLLIERGADIYSLGSHKPLRIYDIVIAMLRTDLMKLFWSQGYPYDFTVFQPAANIIASMKSYFQNHVPKDNKIIVDFKKRISDPTKCKQVEDLMDAQREFINGVVNNNVKQVLGAIEKGAEVKGRSVQVPLPLHFLAKKGFPDVAEVLLSGGVLANKTDNKGNTPMNLAVKFGRSEIYITLLRHGATYHIDNSDLSLLIQKAFKAVKEGDHQCITEILGKYVKEEKWDMYYALINCIDESQRTLLGWAVKNREEPIVYSITLFDIQAYDGYYASKSP